MTKQKVKQILEDLKQYIERCEMGGNIIQIKTVKSRIDEALKSL